MLPSKVAIPMPILFAEPSKPMEMSFFSILGFQRDRERERELVEKDDETRVLAFRSPIERLILKPVATVWLLS